MGYILPLYRRHSIFDFLDPGKTDSDLKVLKEYFDTNEASNAIQLLCESDKTREVYLEGLLKERRLRLFNSELPIPDENTKIDVLAQAGNEFAVQMKKILDCMTNIPRTWPIPEVEEEKERYTEWKKIPKMEEQAFNYLLYAALKVIYYPQFFLSKEYQVRRGIPGIPIRFH